MDKELLKFPNRVKFWTYINSLTKDLDFKNTIKLPNYWFYFKGEKFVTKSFKETLTKLNELCHTKFDTNVSLATGGRVVLFVNPRFQIDISDKVVIEDEADVVIIPVTEEYEITPLISLDVEDEVLEDSSPDWDYVDSLYDDSAKMESKNALEEYARKWDVELPKNKSFANMVKEFKESL